VKNWNNRLAFSMVELLAVVAILGTLAAVIVPRVYSGNDAAKSSACHVNQGDIEIQVELWLHDTGSMPAGTLADIGADVNYFSEGLPTCPVDATSYTIDTQTGLITGHNH